MPTITLHTTGDPVIPYWHETLYTFKTLAAGTFSKRLNLPTAEYGHCAFTAGDVLAAFVFMVLADIGQDLSGDFQKVLPQSHLDEFTTALRRNRGALRLKQ